MATKSKHPASDSTTLTFLRELERQIPALSVMPQRHHLPPQAWGGFFLVALERLHRAKPGWAAITLREFELFRKSWILAMQHRGDLEREKWINDAIAYARRRRSFRSNARWLTGPTDRWLLFAPDLNASSPGSPATRERLALMARVPRRKLSYGKASNPLEIMYDALAPRRKAGRPRGK
jgi:hypothetical protein